MKMGKMVCGVALVAGMAAAQAGNRHFTYSYETTTMAAGAMELESWVTWKTDFAEDGKLERFDMRHEFEYGVSDRLQLSVYFANWRYEESSSEAGRASFENIAVEAIYALSNPDKDALGSALYGEVKGSDDELELEAKLLLQKNLGAWMLVYNVGGEIAWEDNYETDEAELMESLGLGYRINPATTVGVEALHEIGVPDVSEIGDSGVFAGPNVSWQKDRFSLAVTGLWQLTSLADEPDFQLRTIFAFDF